MSTSRDASICTTFSDNYLLGSEWYIGPEYTRDYHYSQLDLDTQYKFIGLI